MHHDVPENMPKIPLKDRNFLPAIFVFVLPWLRDIIIFFGTDLSDRMLDAPKPLLMLALYAAAPFFLTALAMRPRPRVSRALWLGAAVTAVLWGASALTGRANTLNPSDAMGTAFLWLFIVLMIWPCIVTVLVGIAAKFRETPLPETYEG